MGAGHLRRWIHLFSTLSLIRAASGLLGAFLINSTTDISMSLIPLWSRLEKCLPKALVWSFVMISWKWPANLSLILNMVCPTYCILQILHVAQYIRFELLHDIFFIHLKEESVFRQYRLPDLFSLGQYLHIFLLQKLCPLSLLLVPIFWVLLTLVWEEDVEGVGLYTIWPSPPLKKSVMLVCLTALIWIGSWVCSLSSGSMSWLQPTSGLAFSSPSLKGILALTKRSLRFFGRLYPHMSFFSCMKLVVGLLPQNLQFLLTIPVSTSSFGL